MFRKCWACWLLSASYAVGTPVGTCTFHIAVAMLTAHPHKGEMPARSRTSKPRPGAGMPIGTPRKCALYLLTHPSAVVLVVVWGNRGCLRHTGEAPRFDVHVFRPSRSSRVCSLLPGLKLTWLNSAVPLIDRGRRP